MTKVDYHDSAVPIRSDFAEAHSRFWERLARPGSWWSSAERIAIARESRAAWDCPLCKARKAALSPNSVSGEHASCTTLDAVAIEAVHRIATDAARLTESWYQGLLRQGLSDGHYVELVGTAVAMASIDSFTIALGLPLRALPESGDGAPSGYRPASAGADDAWVPMVPIDNSGTPEADLWLAGATGNVIRAMSLVPDEVRTLGDLSGVHYIEHRFVRQAGVDRGGALNRSQMELVA
ncbi:MAG: hypothetical protein HOI95_17130, partial [Chromatiales bacterium]|nr:hypothetical protein [Chromatiales bacterium]